jgi:hypothetical protein
MRPAREAFLIENGQNPARRDDWTLSGLSHELALGRPQRGLTVRSARRHRRQPGHTVTRSQPRPALAHLSMSAAGGQPRLRLTRITGAR